MNSPRAKWCQDFSIQFDGIIAIVLTVFQRSFLGMRSQLACHEDYLNSSAFFRMRAELLDNLATVFL